MLTAVDVNATWWPLFDPHTPDDPALRSVFAGRCPGTAYVDRVPDPTEIVVRARGGETFASVGCSAEFLREAIEAARAAGPVVLLGCTIPESVAACGEVVERTQFLDCALEEEELEDLKRRLPPELLVHPLDREILGRCPFAGETLPRLYGDRLDSYFSFGYGICLMRGEEVVAETYAGYVADGRAEMIAGTAEAHRGRGLASIAAAFLVSGARRRGHSLTWSCMTKNTASMKVARRLKFRTERPYRMVYVEGASPECA